MRSRPRPDGDDSMALLWGAAAMALFVAAGLGRAFGAFSQALALGLLSGAALAFVLFTAARERD